MKVLIDADVILEFLLNREPFVRDAEIVWNLLLSQHFSGIITERGLDKIHFYLSKFTTDEKATRYLISNLIKNIDTYPVDNKILQEARTSYLRDFDSAVELVCATKLNVDALIAWNPQDFEEVNTINVLSCLELCTTILEDGLGLKYGQIAGADAAGRFPSTSDLESLQGDIQQANARLEAAGVIANNIEILVKNAGDYCFKRYPYLKQPGQSADTPEKVEKCYRDIHYYLMLITCSLLVGGTGPLDEWGIAGMREVYRALEIPTAFYVTALSYFKENIIAPRDLSEEALVQFQIYLNYLIISLS